MFLNELLVFTSKANVNFYISRVPTEGPYAIAGGWVGYNDPRGNPGDSSLGGPWPLPKKQNIKSNLDVTHTFLFWIMT